MQLHWIDKRFVADCRANEYRMASAAGFLWDARRREYWTRDPDIAEKLKPFWGPSVHRVFEIIQRKRLAVEESRAVDAAIHIPVPDGLAYLGYQRAGIDFANKRPATLLADEMGLGKTIQAIGAMNLDPTLRKVLIVCPASLKGNWLRELEKWLCNDRLSIGIAEGAYFPKSADIAIINYDILQRHRLTICAAEWDLLVADEAHFAKNSKAKRTKALFGGIVDHKRWSPPRARKRIYITGTPIVNRPAELWPIIHSLDPVAWSNWPEYMKRYCGGSDYGSAGEKNLEELQKRLRASIMIRRLKADVLTDLPPKLRQVIEIPANTPQLAALVHKQRSLWATHADGLSDLQAALARAQVSKDEAGYREAINALDRAIQVDFTELSKIRHETASAKIPFVVQHVRDCLESSDKIVLFAHHKDVIKALEQAFGSIAVSLHGETKQVDRQRAVDRFQREAGVRLFIGGIIPAGVGITLTRASHVIFGELDWVPGNVTQAEDRCHRIGQRDSVLVQHLVLQGSVDAHMARIIIEKQEVIERALDIMEGDARPVAQDSTQQIVTTAAPRIVRPHQQTELF
jgi:SWI/SNF-related matrix-associated actin-dependent regulator 1 of chromatin subfamily A